MLRLALSSRLAGLRRRCTRWLGGGPPALDGVDEVSTVRDHVDTDELAQSLADHWQPAVEMVQFRDEPLSEVLRFTNQRDGTRITLKPVDMQTSTGAVEVYTRPAPTAGRTHRGTAESLAAGLTEATRLAAAHSSQHGLTARSSSHRPPPAARQADEP